MQLLELKELDKSQYNTFVASQESGSFLQSWEWGEWQKAGGVSGRVSEVHRFALIDKGEWMAAAQVIKTAMPGGRYYLYAPYGPVADLRFKIEDLRFLTQELQKRFPSAVFLRIEPMNKAVIPSDHDPLVRKSTNIQPGISMVLEIHRSDEELFAGMHPKTRYNIRLAERRGVTVEDEFVITPGRGLYSEEAINLILQTQARQKYRGHSERYYKQLVDFFALQNGKNELKLHIYKAVYQRHLLASGIMIDFGKTRMYLYGGSSDENRDVMAPYLLHFKAITDARVLGLSRYDFGGSEVAGGGEKGFTRFKAGFGGAVVNYAGAYDIIFNSVWYTIYKGARKINRFLKHITK
jgi:peptidoglycan pentaglycine glycine transferase (the first glycine)